MTPDELAAIEATWGTKGNFNRAVIERQVIVSRLCQALRKAWEEAEEREAWLSTLKAEAEEARDARNCLRAALDALRRAVTMYEEFVICEDDQCRGEADHGGKDGQEWWDEALRLARGEEPR